MKPKVQTLGAAVAREHRDGGQVKLSTFIPLKIRKRGGSKVVVRSDGQLEAPGKVTTQHNQPLLVALTRAFYWQQLLDDGVVGSGSEIAQREGLHHSTVNELLRLMLLEPAIAQSILAGQQPRCMSLLWFQCNPLPTDWVAQREVVAGFDA
ncbi:MAG TPA: site-specific recombinase resolvase [Thauera sp.]|nr:site-specific recombinase resolvase [Thauera sp.]